MMDKLVVFGAGVYQYPLIRQARERGFFVICISPDGNYPGLQICDLHLCHDVRDYPSIVRDLRRYDGIVGVCTSGSDVSVYSIAKTCEALGIDCYSPLAGRTASDKILMKDFFFGAGITTPNSQPIEIESEYYEFVKKSKVDKFVIKVPNSSGSRGVHIISRTTQISNLFEDIKNEFGIEKVLVEEFVTGIEFGAQAIIQDSKVQGIICHGDILYSEEHTVPVGHIFPYKISAMSERKILDCVNKVKDNLLLKNGILNLDLIDSDDEIYIIEFGLRTGATCIPEGISDITGINFYDIIINLAINKKTSIDLNILESCISISHLLYSEKAGILDSVNVSMSLPNSVEITDYKIDVSSGDKIAKFQTGNHRIGHIVIRAAARDHGLDMMEKILSSVDIKLSE
jgi:glutathione synthase/RimK-type ligase-like ATP-grasp enzyme